MSERNNGSFTAAIKVLWKVNLKQLGEIIEESEYKLHDQKIDLNMLKMSNIWLSVGQQGGFNPLHCTHIISADT